MARKTDGRLAYADLLRVFAALAVVVLHLAGSQMGAAAVTSPEWQVFNLYDGLVRWCVPVFVMLSGMFLLDPKRPLSLSRLLLHNALRILVCLLVWGTVYALHDGWTGQFSWNALRTAAETVLRGELHYHLWFLPMILGLYLVTPILRAFLRGAGREELLWFLLLSFIFSSLLPTTFRLWPDAAAPFQIWYNKLDIRLTAGYVGYYAAGYYLKEYTIGRITETAIYVLGILGAAATVLGTALLSQNAGGLTDALYSYFSPNVVFFSLAVALFFRSVLGGVRGSPLLSAAARVSFGIYLVHDFFLMLLRHWGVTTLSFAPAASVPILAGLVFLCSFAAAWLLSKLPLLGRWLT